MAWGARPRVVRHLQLTVLYGGSFEGYIFVAVREFQRAHSNVGTCRTHALGEIAVSSMRKTPFLGCQSLSHA
jgi:hypothetical protein